MESYLFYALIRAALGIIRPMPRTSAIHFLNLLAGFVYLVDPKHRQIARVNLKIAFPELGGPARAEIARASFRQTARNLLEISRMRRLSPSTVSSLVRYNPKRGLNNLEAARAKGRGILYITGHFSAWELLPAAHALHGYPLSFITRPLDNLLLDRYLLDIREASGNRVIPKHKAARRTLETLKSRGSVGVLMDQNTDPQEGVFVDFFGVPACTATSVALFALRTEAPVLPGYLTPKKDGRYEIKFLPAIEVLRSGDKARDIRINTRLFNQVFESIIREQPETWLWGHKRWWYQPPGNPPDLYRLPASELDAFLLRSRKEGHDRPPQV